MTYILYKPKKSPFSQKKVGRLLIRMFSDGTFIDGTFRDGMFSDGMFSDGMFRDGMFSDYDV